MDGSFFLSDLAFASSGASGYLTVAQPPLSPVSEVAHPLLNRPFEISPEDLGALPAVGPTVQLSGAITATYLMPIITDSSGNTVLAAGEYGSGYIVATAESLSGTIWADTATTDGSNLMNPSNIWNVPEADLELAYNIVNWGSEHTGYHKDPRHSGYSFQEIGGTLSQLWSYSAPPNGSLPLTTTESSPAILDDMLYYVDTNYVLHAFDLSPLRDRDGDGSPDDGIRDQSLGTPYDEVWNQDLTLAYNHPPFSSPTAAYVPINGVLTPAVFVTCGDGS